MVNSVVGKQTMQEWPRVMVNSVVGKRVMVNSVVGNPTPQEWSRVMVNSVVGKPTTQAEKTNKRGHGKEHKRKSECKQSKSKMAPLTTRYQFCKCRHV